MTGLEMVALVESQRRRELRVPHRTPFTAMRAKFMDIPTHEIIRELQYRLEELSDALKHALEAKAELEVEHIIRESDEAIHAAQEETVEVVSEVVT